MQCNSSTFLVGDEAIRELSMASRLTRDPYSFSFHEVDSRASASLRAEADLRRKTDRLQRELQTSLLAHHREKTELHDFLAGLRAPLGPRLVGAGAGRRRRGPGAIGRGGPAPGPGPSLSTSRTAGPPARRPPHSEPGGGRRRPSEPPNPVDHFPGCGGLAALRDPGLAWAEKEEDSDSDGDASTASVAPTLPDSPKPGPGVASRASLRPKEAKLRAKWPIKSKTTETTQRLLDRLPLIRNAKSTIKTPAPDSPVCRDTLGFRRCPDIATPCPGDTDARPAAGAEPSSTATGDSDRPRLTLSTLASLQTGGSELRRRIQRWCENIAVELFPMTGCEAGQGQDGAGDRPGAASSGPTDRRAPATAPRVVVTDENPNAKPAAIIDNENKRAGFSHQSAPVIKSLFFPRSLTGRPDPDPLLSVRTAPAVTPGSPVPRTGTGAPASVSRHHRDSARPADGGAPARRLSKATATDLTVISKSLQSFHACKVYRGRNSLPAAAGATDPKAFEDLARAQHRLVQRQRERARHSWGLSTHDYGEKVDAQIRKRISTARWSM